MDRRTQKTRTAIYDAFSALLSEKKYSKITIQEIIDRANIGRSTFYSHFETKDELLKSMCTDIFDHIFSSNSTSENSHDFSKHGNPQAMITHILYHIKDNEKSIKGVFNSESSEMFMDYFKEYLNNQIEKHLYDSIVSSDNNIPKNFLINHISGSFVEMIKWWSKNNMTETPEQLTAYFTAVILPVIRFS